MKIKRILSGFLAALFIITGALTLTACSDTPYIKSGYVFGPFTCNIELYGGNGEKSGKEIFEMLDGIDNAVSTSNASSAVYKFNQNKKKQPSDKFEIDALTYEMAMNCKVIYDETAGIFDPAIYPLVEEWGVSSDKLYSNQSKVSRPSKEKIDELLAYCRYEYLDITKEEKADGIKYYISISESAPAAAKALKIDFGGYAKGFAADKAVAICRKNGVKYGKINISGNLYDFGTKKSGDDWFISIGNPFDPDDYPFCTFATKEVSPVSSGVYERYYIINASGEWRGSKYSEPLFSETGVYIAHIIDPRSGLPVNLKRTPSGGGFTYENIKSGIINATIFSLSSAIADAYATTVTLLGLDEGIKFLEERNMQGVIITADGRYAAVGGVKLAGEGYSEIYKDYKAVPGYEFI